MQHEEGGGEEQQRLVHRRSHVSPPPSARFGHTLRRARKDDEGEGDGGVGGRVVAGEGEEGAGGPPWIVAKVLLTLGAFAFLQEDDSGYL